LVAVTEAEEEATTAGIVRLVVVLLIPFAGREVERAVLALPGSSLRTAATMSVEKILFAFLRESIPRSKILNLEVLDISTTSSGKKISSRICKALVSMESA
jgi:hypothetical protein